MIVTLVRTPDGATLRTVVTREPMPPAIADRLEAAGLELIAYTAQTPSSARDFDDLVAGLQQGSLFT